MSEDIAWKRLPDIMEVAPLFIVNYFDTMFETLAAGPDDISGISRILTERVGYPINALEIQWRNREVAWGVIADGRHDSAQQGR